MRTAHTSGKSGPAFAVPSPAHRLALILAVDPATRAVNRAGTAEHAHALCAGLCEIARLYEAASRRGDEADHAAFCAEEQGKVDADRGTL